MQPLETLRNEHGLIRQFLDNLALAVAELESEKRPPKEFFEMAVLFARTFADTFHHIKEEHVMFVRLRSFMPSRTSYLSSARPRSGKP